MQDFNTVNICNTVWEWGISVNSATGAGDVWDPVVHSVACVCLRLNGQLN